jgi:DNA replication and repair protein RecF
LLALLFAERDVLLDARGRPPLMLLDDVMSELDSARRERLIELLAAGGQAVVTTTDLEHVPGAAVGDLATIAVLSGRLVQESVA